MSSEVINIYIPIFFLFRATAMEVPRRSGKNRKFVGLESDGTSVVVHSLPIAERYFMCHSKAVLQQVSAVFCINIWIFSSNRKVCIVSIHFVIWQEIWKKHACRLPVVLQQVGVVVFLVPNMYYYYLFTRIEWWGQPKSESRKLKKVWCHSAIYFPYYVSFWVKGFVTKSRQTSACTIILDLII